VIASLTTPSARPPVSTIAGVAVAKPARINPPSNPIVKPLAFRSDSGTALRVAGQHFERADLFAGQARGPVQSCKEPCLSPRRTLWPPNEGDFAFFNASGAKKSNSDLISFVEVRSKPASPRSEKPKSWLSRPAPAYPTLPTGPRFPHPELRGRARQHSAAFMR
jgi:hypothetical protein